ncbi:MAG TPA: SpoIIE family protein phosphatase, partial [Bacteroidia bacterium]|nr:SpoIIE family protein phosphatase [Bacteroidia bacterium]
MKQSCRYSKILVLFLVVWAGNIFAVPDSLIYRIKAKGGINVNSNGISIHINMDSENNDLWLFSPKDDYRFALRNYADSEWKIVHSDLDVSRDTFFTGFGWFRLHYKITKEEIGTTFMLSVTHNGASEVFNDGRLLSFFGRVSHTADGEKGNDPSDEYFPLTVSDTLEHVIAVRYSNQHAKSHHEKFDISNEGFGIRFLRNDDMPFIKRLNQYQSFFFISLSMFLFALALVHLMIYLFERSRKFNLYHSIFVCTLSLLFLTPVLKKFIDTPLYNFRLNYYSDALIPTFFISVLALLYNLFQKKLNRFFYICVFVYAAAIVVRYLFGAEKAGLFYISLFFMMWIGSTIISIKAIRQNFRGAKIVGLGVLATTVFMILALLLVIFFKNAGVISALLCVTMAILSLPFSMSVYLAFDFAKANETLKDQIVQIKELSDKALLEEAEKKQILENQNQVLEVQVKERTAEITAQKEVIEEKNKDITDSINYAKRIQDATLASKEIKYKLFPNAFVLFKPKDIVSGDFYWFAGKNGRRLISACDCTGHGVPGALMSMIGNNLLNKIVNEKAVTSPGKILIELDEEVKLTLKKSENTDSKDGMDIALLSFSSDHEMEYAGANRPLWIVHDGRLEEIKATKISIGGDRYGQEIEFVNHSIKLHPGDTVYISSDGFADQFNSEDKKLMTRR